MISVVPLYSLCLLSDKDRLRLYSKCSEGDQRVIKGFREVDSSNTQFPSFTGKSLIYLRMNTHSILISI